MAMSATPPNLLNVTEAPPKSHEPLTTTKAPFHSKILMRSDQELLMRPDPDVSVTVYNVMVVMFLPYCHYLFCYPHLSVLIYVFYGNGGYADHDIIVSTLVTKK